MARGRAQASAVVFGRTVRPRRPCRRSSRRSGIEGLHPFELRSRSTSSRPSRSSCRVPAARRTPGRGWRRLASSFLRTSTSRTSPSREYRSGHPRRPRWRARRPLAGSSGSRAGVSAHRVVFLAQRAPAVAASSGSVQRQLAGSELQRVMASSSCMSRTASFRSGSYGGSLRRRPTIRRPRRCARALERLFTRSHASSFLPAAPLLPAGVSVNRDFGGFDPPANLGNVRYLRAP